MVSFSQIIHSCAAIETHQALKNSSDPAGSRSSPNDLMHLSERVNYYFHRRTQLKTRLWIICDERKPGWWKKKPQHLHCPRWKCTKTVLNSQPNHSTGSRDTSYSENITRGHETVTLDVLKLICKQLVSQELHELGHKTFRSKPPAFIPAYIINESSASVATSWGF